MFFQAAMISCLQQDGCMDIHYVTMRPNTEDQNMTQKVSAPHPHNDMALLRDMIRRSQQGDMEAVESIYQQFKGSLFNLVYRHVYNFEAAEDLLQDIFLKIFRSIQSVRNENTFKGWVYRIALHECYSYLRKNRSKMGQTMSFHDVEGVAKEEDRYAEKMDIRKPLDEAIASLPAKLKSVFILHDVQGFRHQEIAEMMGISGGTSKSHLFKARMRIRKYLRNKKIW